MVYSMEDYDFLEKLKYKQKKNCIGEDNYFLTVCPGSGKTRTITYRLAHLEQKYNTSRLINISITYSGRAADAIETRLDDMEMIRIIYG